MTPGVRNEFIIGRDIEKAVAGMSADQKGKNRPTDELLYDAETHQSIMIAQAAQALAAQAK